MLALHLTYIILHDSSAPTFTSKEFHIACTLVKDSSVYLFSSPVMLFSCHVHADSFWTIKGKRKSESFAWKL